MKRHHIPVNKKALTARPSRAKPCVLSIQSTDGILPVYKKGRIQSTEDALMAKRRVPVNKRGGLPARFEPGSVPFQPTPHMREQVETMAGYGGYRPQDRGGGGTIRNPNSLRTGSRQGKFLPPEVLLLIAENSLAMAARYQPELTNRETGEKQP